VSSDGGNFGQEALSMRVLSTTVAFASLVLVTFGIGAAQPLSPLVAEWDQFFSVQPQPVMGDGRSVATIWNTSGFGARRIQLLVEALDGSGRPVNQRVVWLGSDLPAGVYARVETPMPIAASYRVRVFAFNLEMTGGPR
jgi:hypothetical protein